MSILKWNDPTLKAGTMVRTALWLTTEVGVGNSFTKEQHRAAFSGITQADRRLRDLRRFGWVIHTRAEDLTLNPEEQRFVLAGTPVWERGVRKTPAKNTLTTKVRRATFSKDDYQCVHCGIAGGELYPDAPRATAVLLVSRQKVITSDGSTRVMFLSECYRCHSGAVAQAMSVPHVLESINNLEPSDRAIFVRWVQHGRGNALDQLWAAFRRLPSVARDEVRSHLKEKM
jgi:hypothetical protein